MNLENKVIWQQASGFGNRNYSDLCLKWDVILNGPGEGGKWPDCKDEIYTPRKATDLWRFCEEMRNGDLVVLRYGTSAVYGVGEIVGDYEWLDEFSDVDGWDIQHSRRVRWLWKAEQQPHVFDTYALKQGDTTQKISPTSPVVDWLKNLTVDESTARRDLVPIPRRKRTGQIFEDEIAEFLYDRGVASSSIELLLREFREFTRIAKWYVKFSTPSENETIVYLVAPLLRALGWTPQKMAIEWNNVDLALFHELPRKNENLEIVVEAKKLRESCLSAISQAQSYAKDMPNCQRLIVTDGIRYGVFLKSEELFKLHAYMNLTDLREDYPIYLCSGVKQALLAMTPEWRGAMSNPNPT